MHPDVLILGAALLPLSGQATPVLAGRGMSAPSPASSSAADPTRRSHVLAGGGGMDSLPGPLMAVDGGGHVAAAAAASSTSGWLLHQHMHAASSGGSSSSKAAYDSRHVAMPAAAHYHSYGQDARVGGCAGHELLLSSQ